ncbi:MAG TPA: serine O-acetyltransferase, partial [Beijerinckiaceae bacterium]|nr:serine O-acetyltransferase [Beijerinckiaceae bacterium]
MSQTRPRAEGPEPIAGVVDPIWTRLRQEAEAIIRQEPALTSFIVTTILNHPTLEAA